MSTNYERYLLNNLQGTIQERLEYYIQEKKTEDMNRDQVIELLLEDRHEIVDGELPIYHHDMAKLYMAKLLAENTNFAYVEETALLPENPTVWDIITVSVMEFLNREYFDLVCDVVDELLPELEK